MSNEQIEQKVALVTGASSGIGKDAAKRLLRDGLIVYVAARNIDKMSDLADLGAKCLRMDITVEADVVAAVNEINQAHGRVDVLVNNAGFGSYGAMEDTTINDARYQFEVNLFGLARMTQLVLPAMREKKGGTIINISSIGGKIYFPLGSWYHATKHALEGWSDCLRIEVAPFGINVVVIEPGIIQTEFVDVMVGPLLERSGKTAYAPVANKLAAVTRTANQKGGGSSPSIISDIISNVVQSKRPKTRYAAGKMAKPLLFLRRWLSDRMFDKAVLSMVK